MNKKYQLIKDETVKFSNTILYRIKALKSFSDVKEGTIGGYVESEDNLSHDGDCWLYNKSVALKNSRVYDNAKLYDYSIITGNAQAFENTEIKDNSFIRFNSKVHGNAKVINNTIISGYAEVFGDIVVKGNSSISGNAKLFKHGDYITIDGINEDTITFYRTADNNIGCVSLIKYETLEQYEKEAQDTKAQLMIKLIKKYFDKE